MRPNRSLPDPSHFRLRQEWAEGVPLAAAEVGYDVQQRSLRRQASADQVGLNDVNCCVLHPAFGRTPAMIFDRPSTGLPPNEPSHVIHVNSGDGQWHTVI